MECFAYIEELLAEYAKWSQTVPTNLQFTLVSNQKTAWADASLPPDPSYGALWTYAWGLLDVDHEKISGSGQRYFSFPLWYPADGNWAVFDPKKTDELKLEITLNSILRTVSIALTIYNTTHTLGELRCVGGVITGMDTGPADVLYVISLGVLAQGC